MSRWRSDMKEAGNSPQRLWVGRSEFLPLGEPGALGLSLPSPAGSASVLASYRAQRDHGDARRRPPQWFFLAMRRVALRMRLLWLSGGHVDAANERNGNRNHHDDL